MWLPDLILVQVYIIVSLSSDSSARRCVLYPVSILAPIPACFLTRPHTHSFTRLRRGRSLLTSSCAFRVRVPQHFLSFILFHLFTLHAPLRREPRRFNAFGLMPL